MEQTVVSKNSILISDLLGMTKIISNHDMTKIIKYIESYSPIFDILKKILLLVLKILPQYQNPIYS